MPKRFSLVESTWAQMGAAAARQNHNLGPVYIQGTWCEKFCGLYHPMRKQPPWTFRTGDVWTSPEGEKFKIERLEKQTAFLVNVKTKHVIRKNHWTPQNHALKARRTNINDDFPRWERSTQGPVPSSVRQPKAIRDQIKKDQEKAAMAW